MGNHPASGRTPTPSAESDEVGSARERTAERPGNRRTAPTGTRIIAVANQKGGVGKSTTAVSLGAALAELGRRVLVVDLDPQGNASTGLGIRHETREISVYDVLAAEAALEDAVVPTPVQNLFGVPSTIDLAGAEIELVSQFSREMRLRRALEPVKEKGYDFIFLDCPPSLGLLTINALAAAEELIVPIQCEYYALEGLGQLLRNVRLVQQNVNPGLQLTGIVMTMFDPRTKLSEQVVQEVRKFFGDRVYQTIIPRTVRLSEAPGFGQPITVYDPRSRGAECYRDLAREVTERPPSDAPLPAFENLSVAVAPPPEPHVMSAPRPMARPSEPTEVGAEDRGADEADVAEGPPDEVAEGGVKERTAGAPRSVGEPPSLVGAGDADIPPHTPTPDEGAAARDIETPPAVDEGASAAPAPPEDSEEPDVEANVPALGAEPVRGSMGPAPGRSVESEPQTSPLGEAAARGDEAEGDSGSGMEGPPIEAEEADREPEPEGAEAETPPKRRWGLFRRGGER